jgi:hypothetical protein
MVARLKVGCRAPAVPERHFGENKRKKKGKVMARQSPPISIKTHLA